MTRLAIAAVLAAFVCHARVLLAPGVTAPLPAVLAALGCAAIAVLTVAAVRLIRRDGWQLRPAWRPAW